MLTKLKQKDFDKVFMIMEDSFPKDEYRTYEKQKALLDDERYMIYIIPDGEEVKAFIAVWQFDEFAFVEHFAVNQTYRNQGLGSIILQELMKKLPCMICLEVELPETDFAKRRIGFYERNGFTLNSYDYVQPAMSEGRNELPLQIMTSGKAVSEEQFEKIRDTLYREVYHTDPRCGKSGDECLWTIPAGRAFTDEGLRERFELRCIRQDEGEQAAEIERICFPPNEACKREMMLQRVAKAPELFLVAVDRATGKLAGFLNGLSTDEESFRDEFFTDADLCDPDGRNVMLLGLDVLPEYRRQGLARELMLEYLQREKAKGRYRILLTCADSKVDMYRKMGFRDLGTSGSVWGGHPWHEMDCVLNL